MRALGTAYKRPTFIISAKRSTGTWATHNGPTEARPFSAIDLILHNQTHFGGALKASKDSIGLKAGSNLPAVANTKLLV